VTAAHTSVTATSTDAMPDCRRTVPMTALVGGTAGMLLCACVLSVAVGARTAAISDVIGALVGDDTTDPITRAAVIARVPRTVLGVLVGASLAVAGTVMQAITRNPLAEPGILGVSSGAALAVVIGIVFVGISGPTTIALFAVVGAGVSAAAVYAIGSVGRGGASPLKLALSGAAMSAAFMSLTSALLLPRVDVMAGFRFWQIGGVGGATWERIRIGAPPLAVGVLLCLGCARSLNLLALGDDVAAGLGARVGRARLVAAGGAVLLCGVATSIAGPIAFVGLVVPHLYRSVTGADHRRLIPAAALGGAALLVVADVVGRVITRPQEIEVGIVTSVIGAPILIMVVRRRKLHEL
jgi:iron complex transport system permease protein